MQPGRGAGEEPRLSCSLSQILPRVGLLQEACSEPWSGYLPCARIPQCPAPRLRRTYPFTAVAADGEGSGLKSWTVGLFWLHRGAYLGMCP